MRELAKVDPVHKQPEAETPHAGLSPMDPPEAFAPPGLDGVRPQDFHPFLQGLMEDHACLSQELDRIEELVQSVTLSGFTMESDRALMRFLETLDHVFIPHSRQEELVLFPLLAERMIGDGEHSKGATLTTPVDVMRDEHLKAVQLAAVILNLVRLASVLPDEASALVLVNAAVRETSNLVELLRLHMFREDQIVFASASRLISANEFDRMATARRHAPATAPRGHGADPKQGA